MNEGKKIVKSSNTDDNHNKKTSRLVRSKGQPTSMYPQECPDHGGRGDTSKEREFERLLRSSSLLQGKEQETPTLPSYERDFGLA